MHAVTGNFLVPLILFGWIPIVLIMFVMMSPRRATIWAYIIAWMFLPVAGYTFSGLPDYDKVSATGLAVLIGMAFFDSKKLFSFRPRLVDLPMILWCLSPLVSSITNGLGVYDGISEVNKQLVVWVIPYVIGRIYLTDLAALRELSVGIFIGGMIYVPLCLYEIKMSPQLHYMIYGFMQHSFFQTMRYGGFRPMVFMQHGLMVGMWMITASLIGVWFWLSGALKRVWGFPVLWLLFPLIGTTVMCKSTGATALLCIGVGVLFMIYWTRLSISAWALFAIPLVYMAVQTTYHWDGEPLVGLFREFVDADRAHSLQQRLDKEKLFVAHARERIVFGWGGWGRMNPPNPNSDPNYASRYSLMGVDAMWCHAIGSKGVFGLTVYALALFAPCYRLTVKCPPRYWLTASFAPVGVLAVVLGLFMIDNLLNAMINPIYLLAAGGIAGTSFATARKPVHKAVARPRQALASSRRGLAPGWVGRGLPADSPAMTRRR
jgi:hypothetical protein